MARRWLPPLLALAALGLSSASVLGLQQGTTGGRAGADQQAAQLGRAAAEAGPGAGASRARRRRIWRPRPRSTWQWQLSGRVDLSARAEVYDVDLFETPKRVSSPRSSGAAGEPSATRAWARTSRGAP
jgi:hypothetical protein